MKTALKIATILTWFNLLFWSGFLLLLALSAIASQQMPLLIGVVLLSCIPLNCYAAALLQKSIRRPGSKLSSQTPTGIRFVGFVAMFFAIMFVVNGLTFAGKASEAVKMFKDGIAQMKDADPRYLQFATTSVFRNIGYTIAFLGICVGVNVMLNFRLLRWYFLVNQSDIRPNDDVRPNDEP
jgi:hypothetical protein